MDRDATNKIGQPLVTLIKELHNMGIVSQKDLLEFLEILPFMEKQKRYNND